MTPSSPFPPRKTSVWCGHPVLVENNIVVMHLLAETSDVLCRWEKQRRLFVSKEEELLRGAISEVLRNHWGTSSPATPSVTAAEPFAAPASTPAQSFSATLRQRFGGNSLLVSRSPQLSSDTIASAPESDQVNTDAASAAADRILASMAAEMEHSGRAAATSSPRGLEQFQPTHSSVAALIRSTPLALRNGATGTIMRTPPPVVTAYKL